MPVDVLMPVDVAKATAEPPVRTDVSWDDPEPAARPPGGGAGGHRLRATAPGRYGAPVRDHGRPPLGP
ncbi:hypothetical protein QIS99_15275 [Streptomyces sp. B-S-A8]|uniref:Uncharacterized protein n=1 Tax=Streptomyces solicavernae TaxID=3043614 RepID=A0ABT6RT46_9ACTN|nr:hypothetical protein [Streptomyces sp. B-S-A8]MDI3387550.1 hypothetical protein [Streptomyces sp. B-S-A8]